MEAETNEEPTTSDILQPPSLVELSAGNEDSLDPIVLQMLLATSHQKDVDEDSGSKKMEVETSDELETSGSVGEFQASAEDQTVESLIKLERQMCEVVLHEQTEPVQEDVELTTVAVASIPEDCHENKINDDHESKINEICDRKIDEDTQMKESPCYQPVLEEVVVSVDEVVSDVVKSPRNEVEVKQEVVSSQPAIDTSFDFMDIEDDAPFVRRSRRLQSIHIEPAPIRTESSGPSSLQPVENATTIKVESQSSNALTYSIEQPIQLELKPEATAKPYEIMMSVDQSDERLKRFEIIRDNIYLKKSDKKVCKVNKTMKCDCTITEEEVKRGEIGCQYNCINRLLYIECGQKCRCGGEFGILRLLQLLD